MSGFKAQDEDYWFACLSLAAGGQVGEAWTPTPHPPPPPHTHARPYTPFPLRDRQFPETLHFCLKGTRAKTSAAGAAELKSLKNQS